MSKQLLKLFPLSTQQHPLQGLYLTHRLNTLGSTTAPFVYANFLSSLDGRIALKDSVQNQPSYIPKQLTTDSDFRLFMELHAQADCLITHGGYMRALSEKRLGNILQVKNEEL
ncbi:MAG: riboflavin biosynthesis protein RibD, partial [Methylococcales bacterium]